MISRSEPLRRRNIRRGFHTVCLRGNAYCGALRRIQAGTRSVPNTTLPRRPWERDSDGVGASVAATFRPRLYIVDLGALELAAIVEVQRLPLRKDVERGPSPLAVSVSRPLDAAKRHVSFRPDRGSIDIGDSGAKVADRAVGVVDVLRVDGRREAVVDVVRETDRF